jgi:hypothetical protein
VTKWCSWEAPDVRNGVQLGRTGIAGCRRASTAGKKLIRHQLPLGSSPAVWLDRIVPNGKPDWRMSYCNLGSGAVVRPSLRPD